MPRTRSLRRALAGVLAAGTLLTVAACGEMPVGKTYLSEGKYGTWLAAPAGWQTFTAAQLGAPEAQANQGYLAGFGAPGVTPDAVMSSSQPGGVMRVSFAPGTYLDAQKAAGNVFLQDLDAAVKAGKVTILEGPEVIADNAGSRTIRWKLRLTLGNAAEPSTVVLLSTVGKGATGDVAEPVRVIKSVAVGCLDSCVAANQKTIDDITESWRVS